MLPDDSPVKSDVCLACARWAFNGSAEWLVLLFLLWLIQSVSLSGRRTLLRCLLMLLLRFRMPVELVRGGMAFGDAKGCEVGMVERQQEGRGADAYGRDTVETVRFAARARTCLPGPPMPR